MNEPLEKVRSFIKRHRMLDHARGVVVAVSGGADSVALLDMLSRLSAPGVRLHIAHLDHLLRGRESAEDAEFVRSLGEAAKIQSTITSADVRREAESKGRGIEETAREMRYNFLLAVAREAGCDRIATGHTLSDQAETFLMRLARGAGLRGLAAMRPVMPAPVFCKDQEEALSFHPSSFILHPFEVLHPLLIRPLLSITREEVEAYCIARGLVFRTDRTNFEIDYTRNRVRRDVLPSLRAINPQAARSIARAAEIIADDQDALDHLARSLIDQVKLIEEFQRGHSGAARQAYSARALLDQPVGLRRRIIIEAISRERDQSASAQIDAKHVAAVEQLLEEDKSGKRVELPGSLEVWREFDALVFNRRDRQGSSGDADSEREISGAEASAEASGFSITLLRAQPGHSLQANKIRARQEPDCPGPNWMTAVLDDQALPERLIIRPRRSGQRAHVVGQRRTKKLKNIMIDHKIPPSRRAAWPVVMTPDGRYVWSPGLPPAEEFAAHDETHTLAILRASGI